MKPRILIVDDEPKMAAALAVALRRDGYACHTSSNGEEALRTFVAHGADVVVTDRRMPEMDGDDLMRRLRELQPDLPVILMTAYGDVRSAVRAMKDGAFDYLTKPFDHDELRGLVARALEIDRLKRENRVFRDALGARYQETIVAESAAMLQALAMVDRAAPSDASVLIQGPSGTGKELVAKRLHYGSARVAGPFVAINCKAFGSGVLESELFGHEKGAFTDAHAAHAGCFERADGGTLFLDEIGEVDAGFQAKLLRVLQEGEVLRVGGAAPRAVDVRIVAATNRDLQAAIGAGTFREDLFYRLNVIPIVLPPLQARPEDVLPLALHFLAKHGQEKRSLAERPGASSAARWTLSPAARARLSAHSWPGNVRELENAIERAVVLARGTTLGPEDLLLDPTPPRSGAGPAQEEGTLQATLDQAAAERVRAVLAATGGRKAEAATVLGIDRTTLFRLMKRLSL